MTALTEGKRYHDEMMARAGISLAKSARADRRNEPVEAAWWLKAADVATAVARACLAADTVEAGWACRVCGRIDGAMIPDASGQLFRHPTCLLDRR
jgi:hypothetical protein